MADADPPLQDDSLVLSDVHIGSDDKLGVLKVFLSFPQRGQEDAVASDSEDGFVDKDGDICPPRRRAADVSSTRTLKIYHHGATRLSDVGLQLWSASFLLSDFIINHPTLFAGKEGVELGAGLGLPSIVAACCQSTVTVSDFK